LGVLGSWPKEADGASYGATINAFCREHHNHFAIWSEAAIPYWLATFWHVRRHDATAAVDFVLRDLIAYIVRMNHPDSSSALANPYYELTEVLPHVFGLTEEKIEETFRGRSYSLESLVHLFVRRNWKQAMRRLWPMSLELPSHVLIQNQCTSSSFGIVRTVSTGAFFPGTRNFGAKS
jgi:hypothetical protein